MNERFSQSLRRSVRAILRDSRGFTLIEVVAALVLFGLVSTMVVSVLTLGISATGAARSTSQGLQIARSQLESIKLQAYSESLSYDTIATPDADFAITIDGSVLQAGVLQQIDILVEYPDGSTELSGYKVNHFPPILADFPLAAPDPDCPVGRECVSYFLHNNPTPPKNDTTAQADLTMTTVSSPSFLRYDYDYDIDTNEGRSIAKNGTVNEASIGKFQNWRTPAFPSDFHINGDVTLQLWSASDGFQQGRRGEVDVFLRDWDGLSYTEIATAGLFKQDWQEGFEDFTVKVITFAAVDYVVLSGHTLELKLVVGPQSQTPDMWFMWDFIDFDSKLIVTKEP